MKLSIIIVNYNVCELLKQCLESVIEASKHIPVEIFVVDNHSSDPSVIMLKEKFPQIRLIENSINKGFSTANNQAIKIASGEYILLLNPDTIVEKDCFEKCISFMDNHLKDGALGVRMVDGQGRFLPESKRGLPTPSAAFFKISGISKLFPKSKIFNKYHLGYLDENKIHEVDVLAGAFMFIRKTALDKIGLLDETFFMFGEDIDLSYRLTNAGYKNYYFPETTIVHYKGQSTDKNNLTYVKNFYDAMIIFYKKHFIKKKISISAWAIFSAIYFIKGFAFLKTFVRKLFS